MPQKFNNKFISASHQGNLKTTFYFRCNFFYHYLGLIIQKENPTIQFLDFRNPAKYLSNFYLIVDIDCPCIQNPININKESILKLHIYICLPLYISIPYGPVNIYMQSYYYSSKDLYIRVLLITNQSFVTYWSVQWECSVNYSFHYFCFFTMLWNKFFLAFSSFFYLSSLYQSLINPTKKPIIYQYKNN